MLQSIRDRAQGMIAKFIIGFICLTFALFGVDALFGISDTSKPVAEVNGEEIDERELNRALDLRRRRIVAQMGDRFDPAMLEDPSLRKQVLEEMIDRQLLLQKARDLGMEFSPQQVERLLLEVEDFQVDGRFNQELFERAVRSQGMSPAMFRDLMREEMVIAQLQFGLAQSGFVTPADLDRAVRLEGQSRDLAWLNIPALDLARELELDEATLRAHYEKNSKAYMLPEQVRAAWIEIRREALATEVTVDEAELRAAYDQEVAALEAGEEREAAHLLLQVGEDADEDAVRGKAAEIRAEIEAGLPFAEAVKKYSEDVGSRDAGGALGWISRGTFGEKFDEAVFALERGQVSDPVRTGFGYHLLQVTGIRAADPPTFEELRGPIDDRIRRERAAQLYAEKIEELSALAFESGDLQEPARALNLEIRETGFFDAAGSLLEENASGLVANARFRKEAFADEVREEGLNSDVFEPEDGLAVVVRVRDRREARPRPFEEVRKDVEQALRRERGRALATALGNKLLQELREGESAGSVAAREGLDWEKRSKVERTDAAVPPRVLQRAFAMARPPAEGKTMEHLQLDNGDSVLVVVSGVHPGKPLEKYSNGEIAQLRSFHARVLGSLQFSALQKALEEAAEVRKF